MKIFYSQSEYGAAGDYGNGYAAPAPPKRDPSYDGELVWQKVYL